MSLLEKDLEKHSVHDADHATGIIPDINDPTAGRSPSPGSWRLSRCG